MKTNNNFCEECRKFVSLNVSNEKLSGKIKGKEYFYGGKVARCCECNSEVYDPSINDFNLEMLYNEYRKENDIIPLYMIREIPKKYAIGKRPLSLLLGWGEQTFTRYFDGDIPSKQYSDILKKIYNDPMYYSEILEKNKDNIKSYTAYHKSKKAVDDITKISKQTKINSAAEYLVNQCEDITPLALQKALYYTQGFYYAFFKNFIFNEDCEAWIHGPVYKEIYNIYQNYQFNTAIKKEQFNLTEFSSQEKNILDSIVRNICCYSGKILEKFTHNEQPWIIARRDLPANAPSNRIIDKENIANYFCNVKDKYNMINPTDIEEYAKYMFSSI